MVPRDAPDARKLLEKIWIQKWNFPPAFWSTFGSQNGAQSDANTHPKTDCENYLPEGALRDELWCVWGDPCENAIKT